MVRLRSACGDRTNSRACHSAHRGRTGHGKTTMARGLAMARVFSMVDRDFHRISVERAVREVREAQALNGIGTSRSLDWQIGWQTRSCLELKGCGDRCRAPRIGIFEQAMTGASKQTPKSHRELITESRRDGDLIPGNGRSRTAGRNWRLSGRAPGPSCSASLMAKLNSESERKAIRTLATFFGV